MSWPWILLAIVTGLLGALYLNNATVGTGFIAGACLLGIFARYAQAERHQEEIVEILTEIAKRER